MRKEYSSKRKTDLTYRLLTSNQKAVEKKEIDLLDRKIRKDK